MIRVMLLFILSVISTLAVANVYSLPEKGSRLIGEIQQHVVVKGDFFKPSRSNTMWGFLN